MYAEEQRLTKSKINPTSRYSSYTKVNIFTRYCVYKIHIWSHHILGKQLLQAVFVKHKFQDLPIKPTMQSIALPQNPTFANDLDLWH